MQDAILFLACLVVVARLLKPHWRWRNAILGLAFTYVVVGTAYARKAIDSCLSEKSHNCELAVTMLLLLHGSGAVVLGMYYADLEAVVIRHADRVAGH